MQFLSYIKAHAIVFVIGIYIIACIRNKKNILRGAFILLTVAIILFFGNYAIR